MAEGTISSSSSSSSESTVACGGNGCVRREIMLFGVRVVLDPMRKSVSLNNLSQYEHIGGDGQDKTKLSSGYATANEAVPISSLAATRERKRGVPWSEEEHKLFLLGLQKVGKGDWKGISKSYVKSRTSTQVASHAQKYFLRRNNLKRRRRRSSLFDITTDTVMPMEQDHILMQENTSETKSFSIHPLVQELPVQTFGGNGPWNQTYGHVSSLDLIDNVVLTFQAPLSLNLSLASSNLNEPRHLTFNTIGVA
ncbi:unnamed protein product [Cochlearia groenlandica]